MAELGLAIGPQPGNYGAIGDLAHEAEEAGFGGVFVPEGANDALMCCYIVARATRRIGIYTWIANIHYRLPILCAAASIMVQEAAQGRFHLGLGVSHRPAMEAMGVRVANNRDKLREYTLTLRKLFAGENPGTRRPMPQPSHPIPIYFSALSVETARLAGELADGIELLMCSPDRARRLADAARESARLAGRNPADVKITVGAPAFIHDDLDRAYQAAREALVPYALLPFYHRQMVRSGFEAEAAAVTAAAERGDVAAQRAAISNRYIDSVALAGPPARCAHRLAAYAAIGADVVVVSPRVVEGDMAANVRRAIQATARAL